MLIRILCTLILGLILPSLARAQSVPLPVINGWISDKTSIGLTISDNIKAIVGFEIKYQNPDDLSEFVLVIMRSTPVIIKKLEARGGEGSNIQSANIKYFSEKEEEDLLQYLFESASDAVIYIRWKVKEDPVNRLMVQDGEALVWFQNYSGEWSVYSGKKIKIELMTGFADFADDKVYSIGRKYSIEDKIQVLKADTTDLTLIMKKEKK